MLAKLRAGLFLIRRFGIGWLAGRLWYSLQMRLGLLRLKMPVYEWTDRPLSHWLKPEIPSDSIAYANWRKQNQPRFFFDKLPPAFSADAVPEAERILNGELQFFQHTWHRLGFPFDWLLNPVSGERTPADQHWTQLTHDGTHDIKFIWEASRFTATYTLARAYASSRDERFAEAFWNLVQAWAESNPPNRGPNWMDGQECALRLTAWTFGLYAFKNSSASTPERIAQLTTLVAAHADRIEANVGFVLSTRGNHAITEALGLWLAGLMFPELKHAKRYLSKGRQLLESEAAYQLFPDGTYSMYSLNYHRFVLQIYLFVMRLSSINHAPFPTDLRETISSSVSFFSHLIDPASGAMPVFGSNDGAQAFLLNSCDFNDYRPVLQLGYYLLHGKLLFENGPWDEDLYWLCGTSPLSHLEMPRVRENSQSSFPDGGIHILRDTDSKAVIRCVDYRERPSHADQLHVDLWMHGKNVACDAGTYLYTGEGIWRNGLARTSVHNTVTMDGLDQMDMVSRFTWVNWAQGRVLHLGDFDGLQGEHDGYQRLTDPVVHRRTVLSLGAERWLVLDDLAGKQLHVYRLHWLLSDAPYQIEGDALRLWPERENIRVQVGANIAGAGLSVVRGEAGTTRGWRSRYYGHKEPALSFAMEITAPAARFWTFFGFGKDFIQVDGETLSIRTGGDEMKVDLRKFV